MIYISKEGLLFRSKFLTYTRYKSVSKATRKELIQAIRKTEKLFSLQYYDLLKTSLSRAKKSDLLVFIAKQVLPTDTLMSVIEEGRTELKTCIFDFVSYLKERYNFDEKTLTSVKAELYDCDVNLFKCKVVTILETLLITY